MHVRLVALLLIVPAAFAADRIARPANGTNPVPGRKLALVIGIQNYSYAGQLGNPINDARALGDTLAQRGYDVTRLLNTDLAGLELGVENFMATVRKGDVVVFYYSGHGVQLGGDNYLLPTDFSASDEREAKDTAYPASRLINRLRSQQVRVSIVILDACRDNPFLRSRGGPKRGLAPIEPPAASGMYIAFAAAPGGVALDNPREPNGLFAKHLLVALDTPNLTIEQVFNEVRRRVHDESHGVQLPWTSSSMMGDFWIGEAFKAVELATRRSISPSQGISRSLESVSRALESAPSAPNYHVRATLRLRANDMAGAIKDLTNALGLDPSYLPARRERARAYILERDPLAALADVEICLRSDTNDSAVRYFAAVSYVLLEKYEDAWRQATQIIASEAAPADAYALRAAVNLSIARHSEAAEDCKKTLSLDPENRLAQEVRARLIRMKIPLSEPSPAIQ
jgi:hypothetical protein